MATYKYQKELDIVNEALKAAKDAAKKLIDENPGVWYPCGFSLVKFKPASGRFVSMMKDAGIGRTSMMGGYDVYNPSDNSTQWMDAKEAGSRAFVAVIKKHYPEMNVSVHSRMD